MSAPGANSGQRTKTRNRRGEGKSDRKMAAARDPWGRRAEILVNESFLLVDCLGHSASVLRDSAVYSRFFFEYYPPKDAKTKTDFSWVSRHFRTFKVPTKLDGGKLS